MDKMARIFLKERDVDPEAAMRLAQRMSDNRAIVCQQVTRQLLTAFPDVVKTLRVEMTSSIETHLSKVSVERLYELVRAVLLFEMLELAERELTWAYGVLPRSGVTYEQKESMTRWFFTEVRQLGLPLPELAVTNELEDFFLDVLAKLYQTNRADG